MSSAAFRYSRLHEDPAHPENARRYQWAMADSKNLNFGHGIYAYPGRLLAGNEINMILGHLCCSDMSSTKILFGQYKSLQNEGLDGLGWRVSGGVGDPLVKWAGLNTPVCWILFACSSSKSHHISSESPIDADFAFWTATCLSLSQLRISNLRLCTTPKAVSTRIMALLTWPPQYSLLQYLRLKVTVTILRVFVNMIGREKIQRDRALVPNDVRQIKISIPSRDPKRRIAANVYYPPGYSTTHPTPVLVNWHGSGFVLPLLGSDVAFCSRIAQAAGIVVVDADYRKGPEHPFPGPLNDVEDTLQWVVTQEGLDTKNVGLSGFSAGACLALEAASTVRVDQNQEQLHIRAVVAFYPITDLAMAPENKKVPRPIKPHPIWALHISTIVTPLIQRDSLRPEATQLADRLQEQKNSSQDVVLHVLEGVPHGFDKGAQEGTLEWARREEAYDHFVVYYAFVGWSWSRLLALIQAMGHSVLDVAIVFWMLFGKQNEPPSTVNITNSVLLVKVWA
ncbi:uncharacterized protein JN550_003284 [Neoarthrinium moseri]|uniref:uncharacterized protein n=1 Tax=Neoarthrinium moseri TaxID=1658444 RepID=UPI001FDB0825|nr:uncharacterized protein JN550_003284 [Neoarthrinium moseri]KAI1873031.1 hypothetical protein JN550_003284 [Neoarthrinium moseri]